MLDALKVLTRLRLKASSALKVGEIRSVSPPRRCSAWQVQFRSGEPIPIDLKVILLGDRMLYYLLADADPDFSPDFSRLPPTLTTKSNATN